MTNKRFCTKDGRTEAQIRRGLSKITDNPIVAGKKTITLKALSDFINDPKTKDTVTMSLKTIENNVKFCRDWRNRVIAHKDYELSILGTAKPLAVANRSKIENAFHSIFFLMNTIHLHYFSSEVMFKLIENSRGAVSLLYLLADGVSARKEQDERLEKGD